jgi:hypothetical protein
VKTLLNVVCIVALIVALAYALFTYDMDSDPSMHYHTAECAKYGCTLGEGK